MYRDAARLEAQGRARRKGRHGRTDLRSWERHQAAARKAPARAGRFNYRAARERRSRTASQSARWHCSTRMALQSASSRSRRRRKARGRNLRIVREPRHGDRRRRWSVPGSSAPTRPWSVAATDASSGRAAGAPRPPAHNAGAAGRATAPRRPERQSSRGADQISSLRSRIAPARSRRGGPSRRDHRGLDAEGTAASVHHRVDRPLRVPQHVRRSCRDTCSARWRLAPQAVAPTRWSSPRAAGCDGARPPGIPAGRALVRDDGRA